MKKLIENKLLRYALGVLLLVLLCFNLPNLLFWPLCLKEDIFRPSNTVVLVSACKRPVARGVQGGEVVFVYEGRTGKMYLLDLRTGEKRRLPDDPLLLDKGVFLSSELIWLEGSLVGPGKPNYRPHYILDLKDGKRYELFDLDFLPRLAGGKFDPVHYEYFQSADQVFLHHGNNTLIALSSNLSAGKNVIFSQYSLGNSNEDGALLEQLLKDLNVRYKIVDFSLYDTDVPSPKNKYTVQLDGIYHLETDQQVTDGMLNYFQGWYYDDSGAVVQGGGEYLLTLPGISSVYYIPSPILKLRLP